MAVELGESPTGFAAGILPSNLGKSKTIHRRKYYFHHVTQHVCLNNSQNSLCKLALVDRIMT